MPRQDTATQPGGRLSLLTFVFRVQRWEALQLTLPCAPTMRHFPKCLALTALLRDLSHLENLIMRSPILTGAALLMATLLTGCGAEPGPTSESAATLRADAAAPITPRHTTTVEPFTEPLANPCNGEVIVFSGEGTTKVTDVRGLHVELQGSGSGTGTGPESGPAIPTTSYFTRASTRRARPLRRPTSSRTRMPVSAAAFPA